MIYPVIALRYRKGNKRCFMVSAGWQRCGREEKCTLGGGREGENEAKESA